jgi:hypothetical protein
MNRAHFVYRNAMLHFCQQVAVDSRLPAGTQAVLNGKLHHQRITEVRNER